MPIALYALSYKDTGSVLAFCSLEQQQVVDPASASALRDDLVGSEAFVLAISTSSRISQPITVPRVDLVLDEVDVDSLSPSRVRALAGDPYAYQLELPDDTHSFGDGTPKKLTPRGNNVRLRLDTEGTLTATPANDPQRINLYAILEGQSALKVTLQVQGDIATFPFGTPLTSGQAYAVLFTGQGLRTFVGLIRADSVSGGVS